MPKTIITISSIILFIAAASAFGQTKNNCNTIYNHPDVQAKNERTDKEMNDYKIKELLPIIASCSGSDSSEPISSLNMTLVIDSKGKIIDVSIPMENISAACKTELKNKMLTMTGWTAGKIKGHSICSRVTFAIICIKWEQE